MAGLTVREREVAFLLAEGATAKEVANKLGISPKTVDTHRSNLFRYLGVSGAIQLARLIWQYESQRAVETPAQETGSAD